MFKRLLLLGLLFISVASISGLSASALAPASANFSDVIVQNIPGPTIAQKFVTRAKTSWPWFIARGAGMVAAVALVLLMLSGIGQITGDAFRFLEPLTSWASHRALGITFAVAVVIHMVALLFDTFVPFNIAQLLVPWLTHYKPLVLLGVHLGSLYVALGVLAFYGVIAVVVSSLVWIEKKPYTWKWLHLVSYLLIAFVFVHALYLGTDLAHGIFRWLWIIAGLSIGLASLYRLWRAKTI